MSYKLEPYRVLTGSLNLTAPADLIAEADAIAMHNWRVDAPGALRSRRGDNLVRSLSGSIHTFFRKNTVNPNRYAGIGTHLYRDGSLIGSALFDGKPLGMAAFQGYAWVMNRAGQFRDDGSALHPWQIPAPTGNPTVTLTAAGGLVIGQEYTYWITFATDDGEESNPNPVGQSVTPTAGNQNAQIVRPAYSDLRTTKWNIYRTGNTLGSVLRVNPDPIDIATTTWTDDGDTPDHDDVSLERLGIEMEVDHDPAPAARGLIGPYYNKLIAFNSATYPNRFWWTPTNKPYYFPEDNWAPAGDEGEEVVQATQHVRQIRFYKERSVWRLVGDPDDLSGDLEQTNAEIGLIGPRAIVSQGDLDYFQGPEGIYVSNGDTVKKISGKIDPIFKGEVINTAGAKPVQPINSDLATRALACLALKNGRLYFSYTDDSVSSGSAPNTTLVCDLSTGNWQTDDRGWTALSYEGQGGELLGGRMGVIYALEYPMAEPWVNAVPLIFQSGYRDQGNRDRQKTYADVVIENSVVYGAPTGEALTITAYYDNGDSTEALGSIQIASTASSGPKRIRSVFPLNNKEGKMARNISIRIDGNAHHEVYVFSIEVHYYWEARDAATFDSGVTNLGYEEVKDLDTLELDLTATGDVTVILQADLPSGALAPILTKTITPAGPPRKTPIEIPLTGSARLVRLLLEAETGKTFRNYGTRIRHRPIRVYRNTALGESYTTQEIGVGI